MIIIHDNLHRHLNVHIWKTVEQQLDLEYLHVTFSANLYRSVWQIIKTPLQEIYMHQSIEEK